MGFLPTYTDVRAEVAKKEPFVEPFVETLGAGTKFVPASPGWGQIDASLVLPTMFQEIVSGKKDVAAASDDAAKKMDAAFAPRADDARRPSAPSQAAGRDRRAPASRPRAAPAGTPGAAAGPPGSTSRPRSSSSAGCSSTPSTSSA